MPGKPKLLNQVREKHYSLRTEQVYLDWIRHFILQHSLVLVGVGRKKVGGPRSQRAAESSHRMILFVRTAHATLALSSPKYPGLEKVKYSHKISIKSWHEGD
jgi:hypothetical protein